MASGKGDVNIVNILIAKGADVNLKMSDGSDAIKTAESNGHREIAEILKAAGAR
jgi:ankyrin repeat protein